MWEVLKVAARGTREMKKWIVHLSKIKAREINKEENTLERVVIAYLWDGCIKAWDFEVWVRGWGSVSLHGNKPRGWILVCILEQKAQVSWFKHILFSRKEFCAAYNRTLPSPHQFYYMNYHAIHTVYNTLGISLPIPWQSL